MIIPKELIDYRFIKANENKQPTEVRWNEIGGNNYSFDEFNIITNNLFEKHSHIYGVLCGYNNLIVVDIDDKETQDKIMLYPELNDTFIVRTAGKKLFHIYLEVTNVPVIYQDKGRDNQPLGLRIDNEYNKRIVDVQGSGTQVIGPNSTLPDNRCYDIVKPLPVKKIDYMFLMEILKNINEKGTITQNKEKRKTFNEKHGDESLDFDEVCAEIKRNIKPVDLLVEHYGDERYRYQNPTACPFHTSEGSKCLHHTNNVWYCFHCGATGNVFHLYMRLNNCQFKEAKRKLAKRLGLEDDLRSLVLNLMFDKDERKNGGEQKAIEIMADEIIKIFHVYTLRKDEKPEVWVYKGGIYVPEGRTYISEFLQELLQSFYTNNIVVRVVNNIMSKTFIEPNDFFINEDISLVPVKNGILNIFTRKLTPFSPKHRFFSKLNVLYDPIIQPEKSVQFIRDITKHESDALMIQELFGYVLHRDYWLEHGFLFNGSGRNGKSKLLEMMGCLIGHENKSNVSLHSLSKDKFMVSFLMNKMINLSTDLSSEELNDVSVFKALTGHDTLTCDRKFKTPVQFVNYAKIIIACNDIPEIKDVSTGFFNRLIILEFPYEYVDGPLLKNQKKRDINIINKITTEMEMIGMLNWALDGFARLIANGKFTYNRSTEDTRTFIKRKSSTFLSFLMDCFEPDDGKDAYITISNVNMLYSKYCRKHKIINRETSPQKRNEQLERFGAYPSTKFINSSQTKVWKGIMLKDDFKDELDDFTEIT